MSVVGAHISDMRRALHEVDVGRNPETIERALRTYFEKLLADESEGSSVVVDEDTREVYITFDDERGIDIKQIGTLIEHVCGSSVVSVVKVVGSAVTMVTKIV